MRAEGPTGSARPVDAQRTCSGRLVAPLILYLQDHRPASTVEHLLEAAELHASDILGERAGEVLVSGVGRLLELSAEELSGESELEAACAYRLADAWGGWKLAFWAPTPRGVLHRAANAQRYLFPGTRCHLEDLSKHAVRVRIEAHAPEPDLFPLVRRALWSRLPTLSGLRPFRVTLAAGANPRAFDVDVRQPVPWVAPCVGAASGLLMAVLLGSLLHPVAPLAVALVISGAMIGWARAWQRDPTPPPAERAKSAEKLRRLATSALLHQEEQRQMGARGDQWVERLVAEVRRRDRALRESDQAVDFAAKTRVRSFTHDLRDPLTIVRSGAEILSAERPEDHAIQPVLARMCEAVDDVDARIARVLEKLADSRREKPSLEWVPTELLTRSIRRRLRALTVGRRVLVSVFRAREAPHQIWCDRLDLDRALDLLLIRAVDAALEGSIVVEVGGRTDSLVIKLSQARANRDRANLADLLVAKGREGLAESPPLLVDTVDRLSGQLEVMSSATGATVWMQVPVTPAGADRPAATAWGRVVRLREGSR